VLENATKPLPPVVAAWAGGAFRTKALRTISKAVVGGPVSRASLT
jgi:hypothetical protein